MGRADDERPAELRIGGWLPPTPDGPGDAAVTELIPVVTEPLPGAAAGPGPRGTGAGSPDGLVVAGEPPDADAPAPRRWRSMLLVAVATALTLVAAAAAPLVWERFGDHASPDRQVQPAPTVSADSSPSALPDPTNGQVDPEPDGRAPATAGPGPGPGRSSPAPSRTADRSRRPPPGTTGSPGAPAVLDGSAGTPTVFLIEAEGPAALLGGRAAPRQVAAASGGTVVGGLGAGSANLVRFPGVTVPVAGHYTVTFHYAAAEGREAIITVNGRPATHRFPGTSGGPDTIGSVSIGLSLRAGQNTITFGGGHRDSAPDLDRLVIGAPA